MSPRIRETIARTLLTLLLSLGLVLPMLGVLQLPTSGWVSGCVCAVVLSLGLGGLSQLPKARWIGPVAALGAAGVWLAAGGAAKIAAVRSSSVIPDVSVIPPEASRFSSSCFF